MGAPAASALSVRVLGTLVFCIIGAYSLQQSVFDVGVMIVCGIIGYGLRKLDFRSRR